jgi:NAD(P)-dependent dehydrogenase (short-subunit alcohol dehydrogenase family)
MRWQKALDQNFYSVVRTVRERCRTCAAGGGQIVNITSIAVKGRSPASSSRTRRAWPSSGWQGTLARELGRTIH